MATRRDPTPRQQLRHREHRRADGAPAATRGRRARRRCGPRWCPRTTSAPPRTARTGRRSRSRHATRRSQASARSRSARRDANGRRPTPSGSVRFERRAGQPRHARRRGRRRGHAQHHRRAPQVGPRRLHGRASRATRRCASPTAGTRSSPGGGSTAATVVDIPFPVDRRLRGDGGPGDRGDVRGRPRPSTRSCRARSRRASARSGQFGQFDGRGRRARRQRRHRSRTRVFARQGVFVP